MCYIFFCCHNKKVYEFILLKPPRRANLSTRTEMPAQSLAVVQRFYCRYNRKCGVRCVINVARIIDFAMLQ